jgi:nicotinamidase-related amidase
MASVRTGSKSVLMVVDVQVGVVAEAWQAPRVVANVARAVERARSQDVPVVWVQHGDDDLRRGSAEWQWVPELVPRADEPLVHKRFNSAFEATDLDRLLAQAGATHIVLAGAATNWCIRATAYGALDRGYDLTLVKDAHTTESIELADGTRLEAARIVDDLNIAMTYLSYPGRTNRTASAEDVDYGRNQALPTTK